MNMGLSKKKSPALKNTGLLIQLISDHSSPKNGYL